MKILLEKNVYDAAIERINWVFDEFPNVVVSFSGGKDSTVIFNLALKVARERGRLPLPVLFIDQEAEWNETIDEVEKVMSNPDVRPIWLQMPIKIENGTSFKTRYLQCWDPEKPSEWLREKSPISKKENIYGTEWWVNGNVYIFDYILQKEFKGQKVCALSGVRAEESPRRFLGLTEVATYKWATWGSKSKLTKDQYTLYPLYDWSYTDIWKCIFDNKWSYNKIYDYQYRYGVNIREMRVSNLHHETAVRSLFYLQEIDPELYGKLTKRLSGVDMAGKMGTDDYFVKKLPFMFKDWCEYRDFLFEKLVTDADWKKKLGRYIKRWDAEFFDNPKEKERSAKAAIQSILANDYALTKVKNHERQVDLLRRDKKLKKQNDG